MTKEELVAENTILKKELEEANVEQGQRDGVLLRTLTSLLGARKHSMAMFDRDGESGVPLTWPEVWYQIGVLKQQALHYERLDSLERKMEDMREYVYGTGTATDGESPPSSPPFLPSRQ